MFDPGKERLLAEEKIKGSTFDFTAKYFAVYELQTLAEKYPETITPETIHILEGLLKDRSFSCQRQGFFLFRLTANALRAIVTNCSGLKLAEFAMSALNRVLSSTSGHAHRAAAEALGSLPFDSPKPGISPTPINRVPSASWDYFAADERFSFEKPPAFKGRSLVTECRKNDCLLVLKFARPSDTPEILEKEILWIEHLRSKHYKFSRRFDIPVPVRIKNKNVFRLRQLPVKTSGKIHPQKYAIAFLAHRDYFTYPNGRRIAKSGLSSKFSEIMFRNSWLLGCLTSNGVVHSALIPLFHNRVQSGRRRDQGVYEWFRAGRLDRWLDSCDFPNVGESGLRDFEHLCVLQGRELELYRHMGAQFLSLLLLAGSYFRNKDAEKVGMDKHGRPFDVRRLFDPELLKQLLGGIFRNYYHGFTGARFKGELPFDCDLLTDRMIQEMGVDKNMEEVLRVADQNEMSEYDFRQFLLLRGFSEQQIMKMKKGKEEIVILSGPHLGGFNETISVPEMIEGVAAMSAVCISGKFSQQQRKIRKPVVN